MDLIAFSDTTYRVLLWVALAVLIYVIVGFARLVRRFRTIVVRIEAEYDTEDRACRVCGCTDYEACSPSGCHWVDVDLCSECVARADG